MPAAVRIAVTGLLVVLAVIGAAAASPLFDGQMPPAGLLLALGATALLLCGVAIGSRLAWRATRLASAIAGLGLIAAAVWYARTPPEPVTVEIAALSDTAEIIDTAPPPATLPGVDPNVLGAAALLVLGVALGVVYVALGTRSSRGYYDLICPACGSDRTRPVGLTMATLRCRRCDHEWW